MTTPSKKSTQRVPVLFLIQNLEMGGAEKLSIRLARLLRDQGWEIHLAVLQKKGTLVAEAAQFGIPVHELGIDFSCGLLSWRFPLEYLKGLWRLRKLIRTLRAKLVLSFMFWQDCLAVPAALLSGGCRRAITQRVGMKEEYLVRRHYLLMDAFNNFFAGAIISFSYAVWRDHAKHEPFFHKRSVLILTGMDAPVPMPSPVPISANLEHQFVVGNVANLKPVKRWDIFLRVIARVRKDIPEVRGILAGRDMGERAKLEQLAKELGITDAVLFLNEVPNSWSVFPHLDAVLITSDTEGFSNTLLEAALFGVPVVSTRVGGAEELIHPGKTGQVAECGDVEGLAEAIIRIYREPDQARRMAEAAQGLTRRDFSAERMAEAYGQLFDHLLQYRVWTAPTRQPAVISISQSPEDTPAP